MAAGIYLQTRPRFPSAPRSALLRGRAPPWPESRAGLSRAAPPRRLPPRFLPSPRPRGGTPPPGESPPDAGTADPRPGRSARTTPPPRGSIRDALRDSPWWPAHAAQNLNNAITRAARSSRRLLPPRAHRRVAPPPQQPQGIPLPAAGAAAWPKRPPRPAPRSRTPVPPPIAATTASRRFHARARNAGSASPAGFRAVAAPPLVPSRNAGPDGRGGHRLRGACAAASRREAACDAPPFAKIGTRWPAGRNRVRRDVLYRAAAAARPWWTPGATTDPPRHRAAAGIASGIRCRGFRPAKVLHSRWLPCRPQRQPQPHRSPQPRRLFARGSRLPPKASASPLAPATWSSPAARSAPPRPPGRATLAGKSAAAPHAKKFAPSPDPPPSAAP